MDKLINQIITTRLQISKHVNYFQKNVSLLWYGTNQSQNGTSEKFLTNILRKSFPNANDIKVEDMSGGCGAMYSVYVETIDFKGLPIRKQHQAVYAALHEQIKQIHGIHVVTKAPP